MKKDFIKELAELINKHSLEKEMRDTPDYILAQVYEKGFYQRISRVD
uniref:Uncharacterized protein n=1 Tax=Siphoviridae sp. ctHMI2 TaxID=2826231 RepID=A0A8S5MJB4_9CAUD|nr:MAG TPA: hypothetical protein [Siphoviridae sp. ctHMI2]